MQLSTDLVKGLEIINPFLMQHDFELDNFVNDITSGDQFKAVSYANENKKFIIDYRFSIGQVLYQFDNSIVSHPFYLDQLGFADKKWHKDFLSENKLEAFKHILHDFEYLIDDFFKGECLKLKEFSKLQDTIITELDRKIRDENSIRFDNIRIDKARIEFRNKDFRKSLAIYRAIDHKNLIMELDQKIIDYCKRHT